MVKSDIGHRGLLVILWSLLYLRTPRQSWLACADTLSHWNKGSVLWPLGGMLGALARKHFRITLQKLLKILYSENNQDKLFRVLLSHDSVNCALTYRVCLHHGRAIPGNRLAL